MQLILAVLALMLASTWGSYYLRMGQRQILKIFSKEHPYIIALGKNLIDLQ